MTSDTFTCCLVRLAVGLSWPFQTTGWKAFPLLTLLAFLAYRRTEATSPLRKLQAQEQATSPPNGNDLRVPLAEVPLDTVGASFASSTSSVVAGRKAWLRKPFRTPS